MKRASLVLGSLIVAVLCHGCGCGKEEEKIYEYTGDKEVASAESSHTEDAVEVSGVALRIDEKTAEEYVEAAYWAINPISGPKFRNKTRDRYEEMFSKECLDRLCNGSDSSETKEYTDEIEYNLKENYLYNLYSLKTEIINHNEVGVASNFVAGSTIAEHTYDEMIKSSDIDSTHYRVRAYISDDLKYLLLRSDIEAEIEPEEVSKDKVYEDIYLAASSKPENLGSLYAGYEYKDNSVIIELGSLAVKLELKDGKIDEIEKYKLAGSKESGKEYELYAAVGIPKDVNIHDFGIEKLYTVDDTSGTYTHYTDLTIYDDNEKDNNNETNNESNTSVTNEQAVDNNDSNGETADNNTEGHDEEINADDIEISNLEVLPNNVKIPHNYIGGFQRAIKKLGGVSATFYKVEGNKVLFKMKDDLGECGEDCVALDISDGKCYYASMYYENSVMKFDYQEIN